MPQPIVSTIIVNWNGSGFLKGCLESISRQSYPSFEVILVDNGSTDGSILFVRDNFPQTIIIENKSNEGFAAPNNQGIRAAKGKYIATLNNDTVVDKEWLSNLVNVAELSENHVGMWAPKILSMKEPAKIDSVGGLLIYKDGIARGRGRLEEDRGQYDRVEEVLFPSACSALYRKDMLDEIGYFDEDFFAYCEDTDLGLRARLAGWNAVSVPDAVVYHHYSGSAGRYSDTKAFLVERNHIWVVMKNLPFTMVVLMPFYTLWRWMVQLLHVARGRGATSRYVKDLSIKRFLVVLIKVYTSAISGIPTMWEKREAIQKRKVVSNIEVRKLLRKYRLSAAEVVSE